MMARRHKWPFKYVEVIWDDTHSDSKWRDLDESPLELAEVHSRGWLLKKSSKSLTLAASLIVPTKEDKEGSHTCGDVITIPRKCVQEIREL